MPEMTVEEVELLAIVVAHDAPMRFAELGRALYGDACTLDHAASRARTTGMRLVEQGALFHTGRYGAILPTEKGRLAIALAMVRDPGIADRYFGHAIGGTAPPPEHGAPRPAPRQRAAPRRERRT